MLYKQKRKRSIIVHGFCLIQIPKLTLTHLSRASYKRDLTNSPDLDERPQNAVSHWGLHCLLGNFTFVTVTYSKFTWHRCGDRWTFLNVKCWKSIQHEWVISLFYTTNNTINDLSQFMNNMNSILWSCQMHIWERGSLRAPLFVLWIEHIELPYWT